MAKPASATYSGQDVVAANAALKQLTPAVRQWVAKTFGTLTPPQAAAIPLVHAGRNVLISAPTGTGKTLAAFLSVLSELVRGVEEETLAPSIHAVYVSPLRALGYDIQRNLEWPLAEICATVMEGRGGDSDHPPCIRVASRTGDTSPTDRRRLLTSPPHILVTTPESLAILLSTPSFKDQFASVRWMIVDEIHAVAGNKRGTHLALSLERLAAAAAHDPVRIGLSATIAPLEDVARWLTGPRRRCSVVSWKTARASTFTVRSVLTGDVVPNPSAVQRAATTAVTERIAQHRTTLIFTNTRGATERLAHRLIEQFGSDSVAAHHSSLSREERMRVEQQLRDGHLRAVVTSTSLELGIDIGTVDETILLSSPRDVTRALQRIGRSGHRIDRHPMGRFIATGVDDLIECAVIAERCASGTLDPLRMPVAPLDVLAQQLVGMAVTQAWRDDDAFQLVRRTAPYAKLSRDDFNAVLDYLAETNEAFEERRVYAKIERQGGVFQARSTSVGTIFYQNVGTISGGASLRVKSRATGELIGTVEEGFVEQIKAGDRFLLGGRIWSFMYAQGMTAFVAPTGGRPSVPRWASEILPASAGVARGVADFRVWMRDQLLRVGELGLRDALMQRLGIDTPDAAAVAQYAASQQALAPIPDPHEIVVDRWVDPDDERVVVHGVTSPLGRRANDALARVIAYRAGRNAGILVDDQAFAIRAQRRGAWTADTVGLLFALDSFERDLHDAVARSDLWGRRFRQVAAIGLMLVKNYRNRSKFVGGMQHNARKIWTLLEQTVPNFPLVRETYRTVLHDDLDVPTVVSWLHECKGCITIRDVAAPPPFMFRLLAAGTTDSMLLEERDAFLRRLWEQAQDRAQDMQGR